jgi:hypothetical protein
MLQLPPYHVAYYNCYDVSNQFYMFTMLEDCSNLSSLDIFITTPLSALGISNNFFLGFDA